MSSSIAETANSLTRLLKSRRSRSAKRATNDIDALAKAAQKIGDVVKLIRDIAGQTNRWH